VEKSETVIKLPLLQVSSSSTARGQTTGVVARCVTLSSAQQVITWTETQPRSQHRMHTLSLYKDVRVKWQNTAALYCTNLAQEAPAAAAQAHHGGATVRTLQRSLLNRLADVAHHESRLQQAFSVIRARPSL
jgi:hypothetical protein